MDGQGFPQKLRLKMYMKSVAGFVGRNTRQALMWIEFAVRSCMEDKILITLYIIIHLCQVIDLVWRIVSAVCANIVVIEVLCLYFFLLFYFIVIYYYLWFTRISVWCATSFIAFQFFLQGIFTFIIFSYYYLCYII